MLDATSGLQEVHSPNNTDYQIHNNDVTHAVNESLEPMLSTLVCCKTPLFLVQQIEDTDGNEKDKLKGKKKLNEHKTKLQIFHYIAFVYYKILVLAIGDIQDI